MGQGFKNHYESTKFQAEVWVRESMDRVPTTILRPAIVVGDSQTGETQKFDGPYFMLRAISRPERARPADRASSAASEAPFNVVPVDFVVDAIAARGRRPRRGRRDAPPGRPRAASSSRADRRARRSSTPAKPRGPDVPPRLVEASLRSSRSRGCSAARRAESIAYLNHPVRFDTRRARRPARPARPAAARFREYVGAMVEFFREHEDDPALVPAI